MGDIYGSDFQQGVLNRLKSHTGDLVLDVETSGLDPRRNHIVAYVITFGGAPEDTVYVPLRHAGGGNLVQGIPPQEPIANTKVQPFEHELSKVFLDCNLNIIGHNLMFDLLFMAHHGIKFNNAKFSCTQTRQALVDEFTPGFSLDASARHMHVTEKKGDALYAHLAALFGCEADKKSMAHYWRTAGNDPIVVDYATGDGVSTWELYYAQAAKIDAQELQKVWKLEQRTTKTLFDLQHNGVRIDVNYMMLAREKLNKECDAMRLEFNQYGGDDGFQERSAAHVEKAYRANGFIDSNFVRTATGRISFTEEWMMKNDIGKKIIAIRKKANLVASFIGPLLDTHLVGDRVHPSYSQLKGDEFGTISGRLSSFGPNVQQVTSHDEELSKTVRTGWLPDEGYKWSSSDLSQCEPRIFAQYTGSQFLIDGYMSTPPTDLYSSLSKITGISRQKAKKLALALFYTAGKEKAAQLIGCSVEEAIEYRNQVRNQIPEIEAFNKGAENNVRIRAKTEGIGYVKTVTGRKLRFNDLRFAYKAGNRIVQGGNADLIKHAINEVHDFLKSNNAGRVLLSCHDSIEWTFVNDKVNQEAIKVMENAAKGDMINFKLPQIVENGTGNTWAEASWAA